jgi:hypothetical protein
MKKRKPKDKTPREYVIHFDYMKTNKTNLEKVVRSKSILSIINGLVMKTNKIVIHSYQFLKLYLLHLYETFQPFPILDKEFICDIFKVVTIRSSNKGGYSEETMPQKLRSLTSFYREHYQSTIANNETIYYDKLPYILAYEAIDMITNITNNIQEHFIDHLHKYVNITFNVKSQSDAITRNNKDKTIRKQLHKQLYDEYQKIKKDLISFGNFTSDQKYHHWIEQERNKLFPNKTEFENNNIHYELKSNTQFFLHGMFHICRQLEIINESRIANEEKQIRLFQTIPLRTNIVPKHICIDTCGLIQNLVNDSSSYSLLCKFKKENLYDELWKRFFKINKRVFKKDKTKYQFNYMIRTDGISCCVLFTKVDENGKPLHKSWAKKECCQEEQTKYIENTDKSLYENKKVVCADPNMSDLIYCGWKDENDKLITFRYTQNQRRVETRMKKYQKIRNTINKETWIETNTVEELQSVLSSKNCKVCNYDKFKEYCILKNALNSQLYTHYEQRVFRKLKFHTFINTQKSESKMIQNFQNKYGTPEGTVFVMGDYDKGGYNMKGKEPVICKKFRRLFKNAGYQTYLINEYHTSKLCNCCHNELEYFMERESKKPKTRGQIQLCHGLLRCKSVTPLCQIIHNRDKNAVTNMLAIVNSLKETGKRPTCFSRETS